MKKLKLLIIAAVSVLVVGMPLAPSAYAACSSAKSCINAGINDAGGAKSPKNIGKLIKTIVNILLFVLGAASVIMIVIGGFKYTTSQGDSSSLTSAKNTILYSVIGLIVALAAYAIVNFVVKQF